MEQGTTTIIQHIPSKTSDERPIVRLESRVKENVKAPIIFVLPGIEGALQILETFTRNLNCHVFGVQYAYNNPEETVQKTAENILPVSPIRIFLTLLIHLYFRTLKNI